jgi:YhcH/YjgK/YiaL family protein
MRKFIISPLLVLFILGLSVSSCTTNDPGKWSDLQVENWFAKGMWHNGWNITPDPSINKRELAVAYFKNKDRWDKAFTFLSSGDLARSELRRYDLDGDNLYATISEYMTKNPEDVNFEAHRKYIDIQYVIVGSELMQLSTLSNVKKVVSAYNPEKDIEFYEIEKSSDIVATPDNFLVFLPSDLHRPGLKTGENAKVRKVVVKIKID